MLRTAISLVCAAAAVLFMVPTALADAGYDKGFVIKDAKNDNYKLKIGGRVQPGYRWLSIDPGEGDRDNQQAFQVSRARIKISGHMHDKNLKFFLQADFGKSKVGIKDAGMEYLIVPNKLHLKAGQFKKGFSMQQLTSSSKLELINRSLSVGEGPSGRDVGFQLGNGKKSQVTWAAGVFNGNGTAGTPDDFKPVAVARVVYRHNKIKNLSEADLEGGGFRMAVGGNVNADMNMTNDADAGITAGGDLLIKVQGLSVSGEFYTDMTEGAEKTGMYAQAGYVVGGKYQPVVRYSMVDFDGDKNNETEMTAGLSVYYRKHNVKWQTAFSMEASDTTDRLVQSQLQFAF
jgi:hypothetical protein